eukprot:Nk52_evm66s212 gene=Nk52_evmTU66s212
MEEEDQGMKIIPWSSGKWTSSGPAEVTVIQDEERGGGRLRVRAQPQSDYWSRTGYGFIHDNGHGLLHPFPAHSAMHVRFVLPRGGTGQGQEGGVVNFDQAGLFMQGIGDTNCEYGEAKKRDCDWVKAGIEYSDGKHQLGAVVTTKGYSDWSVGPIDEKQQQDEEDVWEIRLSRTEDSVTMRARRVELDATSNNNNNNLQPLRLVRLFHIDPSLDWSCGPFLCSPSRTGPTLVVDFLSWTTGEPDASIH